MGLLSKIWKSPEEKVKDLNADVHKRVKQGDTAGARSSASRATEIAGKAFGENHSYYAIALVDEGFLLCVTGDDEGGTALYRRALPIYTAVKPGVPYFLNPLMEFAIQRGEQGQIKRALRLFDTILGLFRDAKAECTEDYSQALLIYARLQEADGQLEAAEITRKLRVDVARASGDSNRVNAALNGLGLWRKQLGNLAGSIEAYDEALRAAPQGAEGDQARATALNNLGIAHRASGNAEQAASNLAQSAEIRRRVLGDRHPETLETLYNLVDAQAGIGDCAAAAENFKLFLAGNPEVSATGTPADLAKRIGDGSLAKDKNEDAIAFTRLALHLREHELAENGVELSRVLWQGALVLHDGGDLKYARKTLERAVGLLEIHCGADDIATINAKTDLAMWQDEA